MPAHDRSKQRQAPQRGVYGGHAATPVNHLVGVNLVFVALLSNQAPPERGADHLGDDSAGAYHASGTAVRAAFEQPGVLERTYHGPLDDAPAIDRLVAFLGRPVSACW